MMFRRHMQDIRQRMDHFEQFGRSKGPQGFEIWWFWTPWWRSR